MSDTTFAISSDVTRLRSREVIDYVNAIRTSLRRPIEQHWIPQNPIVTYDNNHALLSALCHSFYDHVPLRLSPDTIWLTLARGFALHVNKNAEKLRHKFVNHSGQATLVITRQDFLPGQTNPWPEAFESFSEQIDEHTGGLSRLVRAKFSTSGPTEVAVSNLMAMETFKSYFKYEMRCGCGIPKITLTGTADDWLLLQQRAQQFSEYGLEHWLSELTPVLEQFYQAKCGDVDLEFWQSMFRYKSGSGPAVMTGWINVLFPYFNHYKNGLFPNPCLSDWRQRFEIDTQQSWREYFSEPQGAGIGAVPNCMTSIPLKVEWGKQTAEMRLVGGLLAVSQDPQQYSVAPECGWVLVYENPVDSVASAANS